MSWSAERSVRRKAGRVLAVLTAVLAVVLLPSGPASAHAELELSYPQNGAALATPPASVVLRFAEGVATRFSSARLVDGTGDVVASTVQRISPDGRTLSLSLARATVPDGAYGILWRVVAEDDGHATSGAIAFSVGPGGVAATPVVVPPAASDPAGPSPLDSARRGLGLLALSLVIGGLAVAALVLRGDLAAPRRRVLRLVTIAAAAGLAVGLADLAHEASQLGGGSVIGTVLTQTRWGRLWLAQQAAMAIIALLALRTGRRVAPILVGATLTLAVTEALGSHAASQSGTAVAVLTLHVLAACTWVGALPTLALVLWRGRTSRDGMNLLRDNRFRISWLLSTSVCVLVASGLYSAGWGVAQLSSLTSTTYGQTLLVKVGLVALALVLAAVNSSLLHNARPLRSFLPRRTARGALSPGMLALEIAATLMVVGATGVLVESPPARGTPPPASPVVASARPASSGASVDDLVVSLVVSPNQPGLNAFTVLASSSRRPDPAPATGAVLHLDQAGAASTVTLHENAPGQYFGTGLLMATNPSGPSPVGVTIDVARGATSARVHLPWSVSPTPRAVPAVQQPAPPRRTAPYADGLALAVLVVGAGAAAWAVRRRRTAGGPPPVRQPVLERLR